LTHPPRPTCREESAAVPERDGAQAERAPDVVDGESFESRSLVFRAGGRVYACEVSAVREVVPLDARARLTRMPGAPDTVVGLLNVRGRIVTVLDAGGLLHRAATAWATTTGGAHAMALIVDCGAHGVGLAVERVADVRALRTEEGYQQLDVRALVRAAVVLSEE
jgi:chemotaxis signal transduction protein